MGLPVLKLESQSDVFDDERQSDKVSSRARLRIGDLLHRPFDVRSIALTGLFILAVFYTIYFMRSVLLPIVLALLLSYLLRPIARGLVQLKIPLPVSAAFILIGLLAVVGCGISALATPAVGWIQKAPQGLTELQHKLLPVKRSVAQVSQATSEIEKLASTNAEAKAVEVMRHPIIEMFLMRTPDLIASAVLLYSYCSISCSSMIRSSSPSWSSCCPRSPTKRWLSPSPTTSNRRSRVISSPSQPLMPPLERLLESRWACSACTTR